MGYLNPGAPMGIMGYRSPTEHKLKKSVELQCSLSYSLVALTHSVCKPVYHQFLIVRTMTICTLSFQLPLISLLGPRTHRL